LLLAVVVHAVATVSLGEVLREVELTRKDSLRCVLVEPFDALAVFPETALRLLVWHNVDTETVLLPAEPHALVLAEISPGVYAVTVLLVVSILAFVAAPVLPGVNTHALHVVVEPLALVLAAIEPSISP